MQIPSHSLFDVPVPQRVPIVSSQKKMHKLVEFVTIAEISASSSTVILRQRQQAVTLKKKMDVDVFLHQFIFYITLF